MQGETTGVRDLYLWAEFFFGEKIVVFYGGEHVAIRCSGWAIWPPHPTQGLLLIATRVDAGVSMV